MVVALTFGKKLNEVQLKKFLQLVYTAAATDSLKLEKSDHNEHCVLL